MHHMGAFYGMFGQKNKFSVHGRLSGFLFLTYWGKDDLHFT